ncbi:hypothetical protein BMY_0020 [Wohlfahrtiimonas chitiniclastica]|nr:hypothetical protein BMY_0020 [Wohlfahrtiimonas chitiniclastica]
MDVNSYHIYPVGETVLIHPAVLIRFIHEFIYAIGDELLEMPNETDGKLYSYWIKKEDVYTYAFLDKFFRDFTKILSRIGIFKDSLISLQLTGKHEINFVDIARIVGAKEGRYNDMKDRIDMALSQKFYLEAIVLEESSISDRLAMALFVRGVQAGSKNFASLIGQCADDLPSELRQELDQWRGNRNKAVHGLVRSSPLEELIDIETLDQLTEQTAVQGVELNNTVNAWFEDLIMYEMNPYRFRVPDAKVVIH